MMKYAIILPIYKNDKPLWVEESVNSLLSQTLKGKIYIGVDGPVKGDLASLLDSYETESDIVVIRFGTNRGLACVLNDLLDRCFSEGFEYIGRMDADDISVKDRFEKQLSYLTSHPAIDVVGGAINEIDEEGKSRGKIIIYPETPVDCRQFFSMRNPHAHPAVLFRRSFFDKLDGKKYRPEYRQNQDTMLWFDGLMAGTQHANIPDVVLNFRMTDSLFKKRRNGWEFAKKQFADRRMINRGLGYGWKADVYGFAMFCVLISPSWMKKIAYKLFR